MSAEVDTAALRADLERLVRIPSVAFASFPDEPVREAAEATLALLRDAGLADAELLAVPDGPDAVFGTLAGPEGAPTVLLYAHYDVQPAGAEAEWSSPPFEPTEVDGTLVGRGTADDKSGIALHAALLRAFGGAPPVTLKVLIEGDEETGGMSVAGLLSADPGRFAADVIVVADAGNWKVGEPTLTTSLRGLVALEVVVSTLRAPVHSGLFGGAAPDALLALARMLASLHDDDGNVVVSGLEGEEWSGRPADEGALREAAGVLDGVALVGTGPLADRLYLRPSITAVGLDATPVDGAPNAIVARARAKVSARLGPSQDTAAAAEAIEAHLRAAAPWGAHVEVRVLEEASGFRLPEGGAGAAEAAAALEAAYGKPAVSVGSGGAIPLVVILAGLYPDAGIVLWGACDDDARIHSADERVVLAELERAAVAQVRFVEALGGG